VTTTYRIIFAGSLPAAVGDVFRSRPATGRRDEERRDVPAMTTTDVQVTTPSGGGEVGRARRTGRRIHPAGRWSWVWLLVGAALLPVTNLQTLVPVAAWLAPVFLLRFVRTQRAVVGLPVVALVTCLAMLVALRNGFFPVGGGVGFALFIAALGLGGVLPYAADRLLAPRSFGLARILIFPAAVTTAELLGTVGNPFGTAGSTAYSQYAGLPLLQLASITGVWGLTFLVSLAAPVVNELWERGPGDRTARLGSALFVAVLAAALAFGGVRLAFAAPAGETVRVAALAPDRELSELAYSAPTLLPGTAAERAAASVRHFTPVLDDLFARSQQEARAGAKIISWSEASARVLEEEMDAMVARAAALAEREQVYLQVSMIVLRRDAGRVGADPVNENHAVLLDPRGDIAWDYQKSRPTPGDGQGPGPGVIPVVDTPYGRLATAICQDDFFPSLMRQAGRADVDIMLLPSSDWESVAAWHAQQAPFRAVENGVALVRATRLGVSLATDAQGRLVGHKADYFVADDQTLVTSVPTKGADPLYVKIGDSVGYASAAGLLVLIGLALRSRRRHQG
jgi:apolipoprotein N-acyltransferase